MLIKWLNNIKSIFLNINIYIKNIDLAIFLNKLIYIIYSGYKKDNITTNKYFYYKKILISNYNILYKLDYKINSINNLI